MWETNPPRIKKPQRSRFTVADIALWRHLHEASVAARQPAQHGASEALAKIHPTDPNSSFARLQRRALELIAEGHVAQVTPFDIELMEILNAEGEAAMLKRIRQHDADQRRLERRRQTRAARERLAGEAKARNAATLASRILVEPSARSLTTQPAPSLESSADGSIPVKKKPPQSETSSGVRDDLNLPAVKPTVELEAGASTELQDRVAEVA